MSKWPKPDFKILSIFFVNRPITFLFYLVTVAIIAYVYFSETITFYQLSAGTGMSQDILLFVAALISVYSLKIYNSLFEAGLVYYYLFSKPDIRIRGVNISSMQKPIALTALTIGPVLWVQFHFLHYSILSVPIFLTLLYAIFLLKVLKHYVGAKFVSETLKHNASLQDLSPFDIYSEAREIILKTVIK